jgi:hypothetical protein
MSSFLIYLLGVGASVFSFRKFKHALRQSRYLAGTAFLGLSVLAFAFILVHEIIPAQNDALVRALDVTDLTFPVESNQPVGVARGLHPGRVVWVHDTRATNEHYRTDGSTGFWYQDSNADEAIIKKMLETSLVNYAGTDSIEAAWDAIFRSFNSRHGRGDVAYTAGEKVAFKINLTNQSLQWGGGNRYSRMDATPQLLNAILDQLINVVGVAPEDITMGDPYREFRLEYKALVKNKYPGVNYVDGAGGSGVLQTLPSAEEELFFSDGQYASTLPQQYLDATYVINIPCLKTHNEGGITLIAKNHQGSFLELKDREKPQDQSAMAMHYSLPANSRGSGQYRHTVDYMGHEQTGGKALIYIIDGIWAGENWTGHISKFRSQPFDTDYCSSLLVGQDPVALESVGYDILFQEYLSDPAKENYPIALKEEIADHLLQCASSEFWPEGYIYDPEYDGTPLESLGVFEHWNNPDDRQYSRNLGTGEGIELLYVNPQLPTSIHRGDKREPAPAFPNPFSTHTIFRLPASMISPDAMLKIFDMKGALVCNLPFAGADQISWEGRDASGSMLPDGIYLYTIGAAGRADPLTGKIIIKR